MSRDPIEQLLVDTSTRGVESAAPPRLGLPASGQLQPVADTVKATYLMAFTVRCGSNFFCDCLSAIGCGAPTEFFQHPFGRQNKWVYDELACAPDDFAAFIPRLTAQYSRNGIFGAKLAWTHRNVLEQALRDAFPGHQSLDQAFRGPLWIQMFRRDKVAQAISLWRAINSGLWMQVKGHTIAPTGPKFPAYDFPSLHRCLSDLLASEHHWNHWFDRTGIQPLRVVYEDFLANPHAAVFAVADQMQLRFNERLWPAAEQLSLGTRFEIQRDSYSSEIQRRFIADLDRLDTSGGATSAETYGCGYST